MKIRKVGLRAAEKELDPSSAVSTKGIGRIVKAAASVAGTIIDTAQITITKGEIGMVAQIGNILQRVELNEKTIKDLE
jgi:hypothetical protein